MKTSGDIRPSQPSFQAIFLADKFYNRNNMNISD